MDVSRRRALQTGTAAVAAAAAGCLRSAGIGPGTPTPDPRPETRQAPAEGDAISVTFTSDDEGVEYLPDEDAVRYVARWVHANQDGVGNGSAPEREPEYDTVAFERWTTVESAHVAARRARDAVARRLGTRLRGVSFGVTTENDEKTVVAWRRVHLDRDGNVLTRPNVAFDRLVAVTPAEVRVALSFDGRSAARTVPVVVRNGWMQNT